MEYLDKFDSNIAGSINNSSDTTTSKHYDDNSAPDTDDDNDILSNFESDDHYTPNRAINDAKSVITPLNTISNYEATNAVDKFS